MDRMWWTKSNAWCIEYGRCNGADSVQLLQLSDFGTLDQTPTATRVYVDKMEQIVYEVWWTKWDKQCTEYSGQNEIIFQNTYVRQNGMEGGQSMLDKTGHTVYRVWLTK